MNQNSLETFTGKFAFYNPIELGNISAGVTFKLKLKEWQHT